MGTFAAPFAVFVFTKFGHFLTIGIMLSGVLVVRVLQLFANKRDG